MVWGKSFSPEILKDGSQSYHLQADRINAQEGRHLAFATCKPKKIIKRVSSLKNNREKDILCKEKCRPLIAPSYVIVPINWFAVCSKSLV